MEPTRLEVFQRHFRYEHQDDDRLRFADFLTLEGCLVAHATVHTEVYAVPCWHDHVRYERP